MALILFCRYRQPDYSSTVGLFFSLTLNSRHTALHMPAWLPCLNKMKSLNSVPRLTLKPPVAVKEPQPLLLLLNTILLRSVLPPSDLAGCCCFTHYFISKVLWHKSLYPWETASCKTWRDLCQCPGGKLSFGIASLFCCNAIYIDCLVLKHQPEWIRWPTVTMLKQWS